MTISGSKVWFDCSTFGHPTPNVKWLKSIHLENFTDKNSQASQFEDIISGYNYHVYKNGTLIISKVFKVVDFCHVKQAMELVPV